MSLLYNATSVLYPYTPTQPPRSILHVRSPCQLNTSTPPRSNPILSPRHASSTTTTQSNAPSSAPLCCDPNSPPSSYDNNSPPSNRSPSCSNLPCLLIPLHVQRPRSIAPRYIAPRYHGAEVTPTSMPAITQAIKPTTSDDKTHITYPHTVPLAHYLDSVPISPVSVSFLLTVP